MIIYQASKSLLHSDRPGFEPIVIHLGEDGDDFTVVAEMLMVLAAAAAG